MKKNLQTGICLLLVCAIVALSFLYALPALTKKEDDSAENTAKAVRLWNIDTFEGGKGSRTSFLNRVSATYEKAHDGVYIMVSSYTLEGAKAAFADGDYPDMISFGIGASFVAERTLKINRQNFSGGEINGETRAIPWCKGGYALFCTENDFSSVDKKNTVLSVGGSNLSSVAAAFAELTGCAEESSTSAYVRFLNGKYKYLLGTQRDICRFSSRGVSVYMQPLSAYSDLYQYIAVLATDEEDKRVCDGFIDSLLSEETQKKLTEIGMMSAYYDIYSDENALANELEKTNAEYTLNVFTAEESLIKISELARGGTGTGENGEVLKNFLKVI